MGKVSKNRHSTGKFNLPQLWKQKSVGILREDVIYWKDKNLWVIAGPLMVFYTEFAFGCSSHMLLEWMKCFLQVLSEEIFRYSEGEIAENVTGLQASLDNNVFIITMTLI